MTKHTPGPWIAVKGAAGSHPDVWEIASDRGEHEYEIVGHVSTRRFSTLTRFDAEPIEANARLIAAAPLMLAELIEIFRWAKKEQIPLRPQEINSIERVILAATGSTLSDVHSTGALRQQPEAVVHGQFVVPEGWRLVPIEPTWEMWDQAENASMQCDWALEGSIDMPEDARQFPTSRIWNLVCAYRAMVAAAPLPEHCKAASGSGEEDRSDNEGGEW